MFLGLISTALADTPTSGNVVFLRHKTGLRKPSPKEQAYLAKRIVQFRMPYSVRSEMESLGGGSVVSSTVNYQYLPPVGDQGGLGSCAAWASCYYVKTYQDAQQRGWTDLSSNPAHTMSPCFGYNLANGGGDNGSDPSVIMQLLCDHGCATMADMPVHTNPNSTNFMITNITDSTSWPSSSTWKSALTYRANTASVIDLSTVNGFNSLKTWIANGNLAIIGLEVFDNFEYYPSTSTYAHSISTNGVYYANEGVDTGGAHALTIIGYNDNMTYKQYDGTVSSGAFLLVNQWGTNWGVSVSTPINGYSLNTSSGFIWMSYSYIKNLYSAGFPYAYVMTDRNGYTPTTFGKFALNHSARGCLDVQFMGGNNNLSPDWTFDCLPNLGGNVLINQQIVVDLTTFNINDNNSFWLGVYDSNNTNDAGATTYTNNTGQISYMSVIESNGTEIKSTNVPKYTVKLSTVCVQLASLNASGATITTNPDVLNPANGTMVVTIPPYAFSGNVSVTLSSASVPGAGNDNLIPTNIGVNIDSGGQQPLKLITITFYYNSLPAGIDKSKLAVARYDNIYNRWIPLPSVLGPASNEVSCLTDHLSLFALVQLLPSSDLSKIKAYPNPFNPNSLEQGIIIANLTLNADIKIYNIAGELIRTLNYSNGSGQTVWDGKNDSGNWVSSGIYLIHIKSDSGTKTIKVAIQK